MATLTINIPDAVANRVMNAVATRFGYNAETDGTKAAFAKRQLIKWVMAQVSEHEANTAAALAATTAEQAAISEITLT